MDNSEILRKVRSLMTRLDYEFISAIEIYDSLQAIESDLINTLPPTENDIDFLNSRE